MTREEAINFLKGYLDEEVYTEKCVNAHKIAIKSLEQEPVLDKIRAEIEQIEINGHIRDVECFSAGVNTALHIIDKYKAEVECVYKTREGDVEELSMD